MTQHLSQSEIDAAAMLSAEGRYDYFVEKVVSGGEVWSLGSDQGWVVMSSEEGEECLPVWPHRDFAARWASGEWADCRPESIGLDLWLERWTPGMESDGTLLAIFPDEHSEGTIVTPGELAQAIEARRSQR